jgi:hypothetical protein
MGKIASLEHLKTTKKSCFARFLSISSPTAPHYQKCLYFLAHRLLYRQKSQCAARTLQEDDQIKIVDRIRLILSRLRGKQGNFGTLSLWFSQYQLQNIYQLLEGKGITDRWVG